MMNLSAVIGQYNETAAAANLALDLANGYRPFVAAMPEAAAVSVPALATYEPRVSVPADSWLWGMSGVSADAAGFSVQLTDTATKKPLFSQPIYFGNASGQGTITFKNCYGATQTVSNPIHHLPKPLAILTPGMLACKIVNLAAGANSLQLCLHFALKTKAAGIEANKNQWNRELDAEIDRAMRAIRDPGTGTPTFDLAGNLNPPPAGQSSSDDLIAVPWDVTAAGDNVVVAGNGANRVTIYQLDMWNVAQQTITFLDGPTPLRGPLVDFPATSGYGLANSGKPHFQCSPGRPFIINLSAGTRATGFIRYRME